MINEHLGDRLNNFKEGKEIKIPKQKKIEIKKQNSSNKIIDKIIDFKYFDIPKLVNDFLTEIFLFGYTIIISYLYGLGINTIFNQDWNNFDMIGAGFIVYKIIDYLKIFTNNYKNKLDE
jgi:hypothetical protein